MAKVRKPARQMQTHLKPELRRCLGFGPLHYFLSTHAGHRRCAKCDKKLAHLHISQSCEVPHKAYEE